MSLAVLLLTLLLAGDSTSLVPRVRRGVAGPVRGRNIAFPTAADSGAAGGAPVRARPPQARTWHYQGPRTVLEVRWGGGPAQPLNLSVMDPLHKTGFGATHLAPGAELLSARLDTVWSGRDLNGDGEPEVAVRLEARERPLTGQWLVVVGGRSGRLGVLLNRSATLVPKDLLKLEGDSLPLVQALEPHAEGWPGGRFDPPARSVLLALRDTTVTDVSREHPAWFEPSGQAAASLIATLEQRGEYDGTWAEMLLQRTWCLLDTGRPREARVYFEGRLDRARGLPEDLAAYLHAQRGLLEREWAGR